jgi:thioredoxin-dependent peroxiredoxin
VLNAGDQAPDFSVVDQDGTPITLADLLGKWTVLWWFPAAGTPG